MKSFLKRTWAKIDLDNIVYNLKSVRSILSPETEVMGVVKADAYGHGDTYVAHTLEQNGVKWFGVSNIEEAISLRTSGITGDILIFGKTPVSLASTLYIHNITQTVYSKNYALQLNCEAVRKGIKIKCHLKLDTGMGRIGFLAGDAVRDISILTDVLNLSNLDFGGIFTHFPSADEDTDESRAFTKNEFALFTEICDRLESMGIDVGLRHCCNSAGTISFPEMHLDIVRPGVVLYGLSPSHELAGKMDLKPAMELFSTISLIKTVDEGCPISYGRTYKTKSPSKIATIPIGYADGYPRILSGRSRMLVGGKYAPVVGRVCMDSTMIDITGIDASEGDIVTVFGKNGDNIISTDHIADLAGTICYELVCILGKRVSRVYIQNGRQIAATKYNGVQY